MRRIASLLLFICLIAGGAPAQTPAGKQARKACPFVITGLWRSDATSQNNPIFFNFLADGTATLMSHSAETLPQDFEIVTAVSYRLDPPEAPRHIEFKTARGNDFFLPGTTRLEIKDLGDGSFTTVNPKTGERTGWTREQTHLYFVTFAAQPDPQGGSALAMWTVMDGRTTQVDALGVQVVKDAEGNARPVFAPFPPEVYNQFVETTEEDRKNGKPETVLLRLELTATEFQKSRRVFADWAGRVKEEKLPHADPYQNALAFINQAIESLEWCGEKPELRKPTRAAADEIVARHAPAARPLELIRAARKLNPELHVSDRAFPWSWRPTVQLPGQ